MTTFQAGQVSTYHIHGGGTAHCKDSQIPERPLGACPRERHRCSNAEGPGESKEAFPSLEGTQRPGPAPTDTVWDQQTTEEAHGPRAAEAGPVPSHPWPPSGQEYLHLILQNSSEAATAGTLPLVHTAAR